MYVIVPTNLHFHEIFKIVKVKLYRPRKTQSSFEWLTNLKKRVFKSVILIYTR